jgi:hypothetical protein
MASPREVADRYRRRAAGLTAAVRRGIRRALVAVDNEASRNLSGAGKPGAFPIPVRSGHLRRSGGTRVLSDTSGLVFNRARYARAVHSDGFHAYHNPRAPFYRARPFLAAAVETAAPTDIVQAELRKVVFA